MTRQTWGFALLAGVLFVLSATAFAAGPPHEHAASMGSGGTAKMVAADELKWSDVEGFPGLKMAVLEGDPGKGAAHFFIKMAPGFKAGMHFHDADHWVAVVSGTLALIPEGGAEKRLPAGSGFGFTGKKRHVTMCEAGADCVLFIHALGKWDVIPTEKK